MMNKLMKKIAVAFTVAAMTITAAVSITSANDGYVRTCAKNVTSTYEVKYVTGVDDFLNVRSDASVNAPAIGSLTNGALVEVTGYIEEGFAGNFINWVQISYNGVEGYVTTDFLSSTQPAVNTAYTSQSTTQTETSTATTTSGCCTVVEPRVDRQLSGSAGTTWCSLNTDGNYYNEVGARFTDLGNGTFKDAYGNIMTVLQ